MKKIRLISGVLALTMMSSFLTACSNNNNKNLDYYKEPSTTVSDNDLYAAYVLVNNDNAVIFNEDSHVPRGNANDIWFNYGEGKEYYQDYKVSKILYHDKDELEAKVKAIIGQDGQITYEEDYGKVKN